MKDLRPTLAEIHAAAGRLRGHVVRTPLRHSPWLSAVTGAEIYLKLETLQPTFSYKIRGASNAILRLVEEAGSHPPHVVTASAGNHGRAMAHAAAATGVGLTVYIAEDAPRTKAEAIRKLGATLRPCRDYDEAERQAKAHARQHEAVFISPYAHADVIAGAGTVGLEILADDPTIDTIVAAIGGGGLISGLAIAGPGANVCGAEVEASTPFTQGLAAGRIVTVEVGKTLADGLSGNLDPDTPTFAIVGRLVKQVAVVTEAEVVSAIRGVFAEERQVIEGAAAVAVAAVQTGRINLRGRRAAIVLSGANIDADKLKAII